MKILIALFVSTALAGEPVMGPEEAALAADEAHAEYCRGVHAEDVSAAAALNERVSHVWGEVSRSYEAHGVDYLLYWRGVLGQCLGHEDRAVADLVAFHRAAQSDKDAAQMVSFARRRLKRLGVNLESRGSVNAGAVPAVAGGLVAGIGGVMHALTYSQAQFTQDGDVLRSGITESQYMTLVERQDAANKAGFGMLLGGSAAAVAGVVALVAEGAADRRVAVGRRPRVAVVPTGTGLVVVGSF